MSVSPTSLFPLNHNVNDKGHQYMKQSISTSQSKDGDLLTSSYALCMHFEPPRGKTNNVVSDQVLHKPYCTVTEDS